MTADMREKIAQIVERHAHEVGYADKSADAILALVSAEMERAADWQAMKDERDALTHAYENLYADTEGDLAMAHLRVQQAEARATAAGAERDELRERFEKLEWAALHAVEAMSTACDWFGRREEGLPEVCPEGPLFARVAQASDFIEAVLGLNDLPAIHPAEAERDAALAKLEEAEQSEAELQHACADLDLKILDLMEDLAAARAKLAEAREVVRPFAKMAEGVAHMGGNYPKSGTLWAVEPKATGLREITVEHLNDARAFIGGGS